jgi:nucleoside 2-deoxyribosyltransferase
MKLVYVAGPYRAGTPQGVELNIAVARRVGILVAISGNYPVIPHSNTSKFEDLIPSLGDEFWLEGTMELMRKCDCVVLCPGWEHSSGTRAEIREAQTLGIPVYRTVYNMMAKEELHNDYERH